MNGLVAFDEPKGWRDSMGGAHSAKSRRSDRLEWIGHWPAPAGLDRLIVGLVTFDENRQV